MPSVATWMDLEIIILNEVSQKEKDRYHICYRYHYMWTLKYDINEFPQNRNRLTDIEKRPVAAKGEGVGKDGLAV